MSTIVTKAVQLAETTGATPLSTLVAVVCETRGLDAHRLQPDLVAVRHHDREIVFLGVAGPTNSIPALKVTKDPLWLARTLRVNDIPVVDSCKVPPRGVDAAQKYMRDLGRSAEAWFQGNPDRVRTVNPVTVTKVWDDIVDTQPAEKPGQIVIRPKDLGAAKRVTVAFSQVVAADADVTEEEKKLAVRALEALPGATVAEVTFTQYRDEPVKISDIDMTLANWDVLPLRDEAERLAIASLEGELANAER